MSPENNRDGVLIPELEPQDKLDESFFIWFESVMPDAWSYRNSSMENTNLTVANLMSSLGIKDTTAKRCIAHWMKKGFIQLSEITGMADHPANIYIITQKGEEFRREMRIVRDMPVYEWESQPDTTDAIPEEEIRKVIGNRPILVRDNNMVVIRCDDGFDFRFTDTYSKLEDIMKEHGYTRNPQVNIHPPVNFPKKCERRSIIRFRKPL